MDDPSSHDQLFTFSRTDGNQQITFSLSASLPQDSGDDPSGETSGGTEPEALGPWHHDTTSPDVMAAADRVRNASAGDRYNELLTLIDAMVASRPRAGADE